MTDSGIPKSLSDDSNISKILVAANIFSNYIYLIVFQKYVILDNNDLLQYTYLTTF